MYFHFYSNQKPAGNLQYSLRAVPNILILGCKYIFKRTSNVSLIITFLTIVFVLSLTVNNDAPGIPGGIEVFEQDFYKEISECTTALASGFATPDGRPLLWKTRDVNNPNQEYHYVNDGRIPFIGLTYCNDTTFQYYAGVNALGFAIENSNSYNLGRAAASNGWGWGDDDGEIQALALATCRTVDDFQVLLDSLDNAEGRTLNSNYGTFDAFGGAAIFETEGFQYFRHDAVDTPDGFLVRSNYSYSGNGIDNRANYWGPNRHDRAFKLFKDAVDGNFLTHEYIIQWVVRNLHAADMNGYDVPFRGYYQNHPFGLIPIGETVCRGTTASIFVAQGVREGEHPDNCIIWALSGNPFGAIATPLWVRAGSVPVEHDGQNAGRICNAAIFVKNWVIENGSVNTFKLCNDNNTGYWDWMFPYERSIFQRVEAFRNSPQFSMDRVEAFQNLMARQVADSLDSWRPTHSKHEISEPIFWDNKLSLYWEPAENDELGRDVLPRGYNVYRSENPFRDGDSGELLAFVETTQFRDESPLGGGAYYRIEVVY